MAALSPQNIESLIGKMKQVNTMETYLPFPEVITAGPFRLEESELSYLLHEGLIEKAQEDAID